MKRISWNENWFFTKADLPAPQQGAPYDRAEMEPVCLPHTWNGTDGQDGGDDYYRGTCRYVKTLLKAELPDLADREDVYLEFEGVNASAEIYVNGIPAGRHDGGYSSFRVRITSLIEETNEIVVCVDNSRRDTVYPQQADFTFYGGIYRDVYLLTAPEKRFDLDTFARPGIRITPRINGTDAAVSVQAYFTGLTGDETVHFSILDGDAPIAQTDIPTGAVSTHSDAASPSDAEQEPFSTVEAQLLIPDVHLWNGRKDPHLYTLTAKLLQGESVIDEYRTRFGCRSFRIDPEQGFILNGTPYPLHGAARHQDRPQIGNALRKEHHEEDIDIMLDMGANFVRLAHYQHDQDFYDLCDAKGLVVWAEIPYISVHTQEGCANTESQLRELILQNYNHPSIVVWGLSNEITMHTGASDEGMITQHRKLNDLAHELDPTRSTALAALTTCDMDAEYVHIPDAVSYNHYYGWYMGSLSMYAPFFDSFHEKYPDLPIGISEYGAEALNWHSSHPEVGDYTEEYQALYHEEVIRQLFSRPYIWSTSVWNMFDFAADARSEGGEAGMNHKGLVTFDRRYRKDAFYAYKAWLSEDPFVHLCSKRYVDREEDVTQVKVYTNLPQAALLVNGERIGVQQRGDHFYTFEVPNVGESTITAQGLSAEGEVICTDESEIRKVDVFNEAYRMQGGGTVLNWFDITAPDGYCSINDTMTDIMKSLHGKLVIAGIFISIFRRQKKFDNAAQSRSEAASGTAAGSDAGGEAKKMLRNGGMLQMILSMSVKRAFSMLSSAHMEPLTKEEMLAYNRKINRVKKKS